MFISKLICQKNTGLTLTADRTWTCSTRTDRWFTLESSCDNPRQGSSGLGGRNSSLCYSIITVGVAMLSQAALTDFYIVVMTKPKEQDGVTKYQVYRRASPTSR